MSTRLNAYTTPVANGGVSVDVSGMAQDLIMVLKTVTTKEAAFAQLNEIWENMTVELDHSKVLKQ